jgi:prepilin peptidase CpaA
VVSSQTILLALVTFVGAYTDVRWGKVYNWLTYPAALVGLGLSFISPPPDPWQSLAGLGGALLIYGTLRKIGRMGAGDVKMMAVVGAFKGLPFVIFASVYIVVAAALAAIAILAFNGRLVSTLRWAATVTVSAVTPGVTPRPLDRRQTDMPLAPAIFIGCVWCLYLEAVNGPFTF